jgi:hypothetical protein
LDWIDLANNIVYGRAIVGCRNGTAGFCRVKDKELSVQTAVDICIAVLPETAPTVTLNHRI